MMSMLAQITRRVIALSGEEMCEVCIDRTYRTGQLRHCIESQAPLADGDQIVLQTSVLDDPFAEPFNKWEATHACVTIIQQSNLDELAELIWDSNTSLDSQRTAARALRNDKSRAAPFLVAALSHPDKFVRRSAVEGLGFRGGDAGTYRLTACDALGKALRKGNLRDRDHIMRHLTKFGVDAVPHLASALEDSDAQVRKLAVIHLPRCGDEGVRCLLRAFTDVDEEVRILAMETLPQDASAMLGPCASDGASQLAALLHARGRHAPCEERKRADCSTAMETHYHAIILALAKMGEAGIEILLSQFSSELESLLLNDDPPREFIDMIANMGDRGARFVDALFKMLSRKDACILACEKAAAALSRLGKLGVNALCLLLSTDDVATRAFAARWIGHSKLLQAVHLIQHPDAGITDALKAATQDMDASVRFYAAESLARIGDSEGWALLENHLSLSKHAAARAAASLHVLRSRPASPYSESDMAALGILLDGPMLCMGCCGTQAWGFCSIACRDGCNNRDIIGQ